MRYLAMGLWQVFGLSIANRWSIGCGRKNPAFSPRTFALFRFNFLSILWPVVAHYRLPATGQQQSIFEARYLAFIGVINRHEDRNQT
jgi:hypothetical protein